MEKTEKVYVIEKDKYDNYYLVFTNGYFEYRHNEFYLTSQDSKTLHLKSLFEKYLTDKLFRSICGAFPETFNLDYLLNGDGRLLLEEPQFVKEDNLSPLIPSWADAFLDILANQVKENEALNRELRQSIERANVLCANLETLISKL
jgi:hypothetical protein